MYVVASLSKTASPLSNLFQILITKQVFKVLLLHDFIHYCWHILYFVSDIFKVPTVKSRPLAALVDKPQAQIMRQKPGKMLIPIDSDSEQWLIVAVSLLLCGE